MQCAQCHDHPLVDDYLQADYYGLMAFVNRGVLFNGTSEKKMYYAENADGEVNYKSVFTGDARDRVLPKLPQGHSLSEPVLAKEEQYVVAPAKEVRQSSQVQPPRTAGRQCHRRHRMRRSIATWPIACGLR